MMYGMIGCGERRVVAKSHCATPTGCVATIRKASAGSMLRVRCKRERHVVRVACVSDAHIWRMQH